MGLEARGVSRDPKRLGLSSWDPVPPASGDECRAFVCSLLRSGTRETTMVEGRRQQGAVLSCPPQLELWSVCSPAASNPPQLSS